MPGIGGGNPVPHKIGGGPSDAVQAYDALKAAVGVGGSGADGSLEAEWRMARARGLAASMADERAAMQAWPDTATDHIPVYEELLAEYAAPGESEQDRRVAITDGWTSVVSAASPALEAKLKEIDSRFVLVATSRDNARTTAHGRGFEDFSPSDPSACGPAFGGGRKSTLIPNYSSDFVCLVNLPFSGPPSLGDLNAIERAKALLADSLPSWIDFQISSNLAGFVLDVDVLDLGAFGP